MDLKENVSLAHYNTFHVKAVARYFLHATRVIDIKEALAFSAAKQIPWQLIGQGSNVLFRNDYPGLIIELALPGITVMESSDKSVLVRVSSGEIWHDFVRYALSKGWYGLENLSLIPGTVGAAPVQNIGAYGVEFDQFCEKVEAIDINDCQEVEISKIDCDFGYRDSIFKRQARNRYIITAVWMRLPKTPAINISYGALAEAIAGQPEDTITPQMVSDAVCRIRRSKLPDPAQIGNAGSFFWNPTITREHYQHLQQKYQDMPGYPDDDGIKVPAAWLIENAGWKGHTENEVGVHRDHALVLVNYGDGTGEALCGLADKIQASVEERFDIRLYPEVRII